MVCDLTLVADVGGTNTRFALADPNGLIADSSVRYLNKDIQSFEEGAQAFVSSLGREKPTELCTAIAGPVSGGRGKLTNGDWVFETKSMPSRLGLKRAHLLNDLAALGYALDVLPDHMVKQVGGGKPTGSQALVAGIATGFNISLSHAGNVTEAELGHASLPYSVMQILIGELGSKADDFRSVEALFSGVGLAQLHVALGNEALDPVKITAQANGTTALFAKVLGVFIREMTYQYMPLAGLYFNGSVARAILSQQQTAEIIANEVAKDTGFSGRFGQVPLFMITQDNAALYGCAHYVQKMVTSKRDT